MRKIAESFFEHAPALGYPLMALLLFFLVFGLIFYQVFIRKSADDFSVLAGMPLDDKENGKEEHHE